MLFRGLMTLAILITSVAVFAQDRAIVDLGNGIYRFQNKTHFSIFIVGKEGFLLTDPMDKDAATWLKTEITKRFGAKPIKYVVYSHNHGDHVFGGEVFKEKETIIIAHELAADDLRRNNAPTAMPTQTFSDRMSIDFEGRRIELSYHGRNNGAGNISLYVPDAKFLFVVDWIVLKRLPWREMYHYDLDGMIASLKQVLQLDFVKVAPGHSVVGSKKDVVEFLGYLEELRAEVLKGMNEGKTVEQLQKELKFKKYAHYASFQDLPLNIKGAFDQLARTSGRYGQDR